MLFERDDHVGGHAWTVDAAGTQVDIGFQVSHRFFLVQRLGYLVHALPLRQREVFAA